MSSEYVFGVKNPFAKFMMGNGSQEEEEDQEDRGGEEEEEEQLEEEKSASAIQSDNKEEEGYYIDGLKEGAWFSWFPTGIKSSEGTFSKNERSGTSTTLEYSNFLG